MAGKTVSLGIDVTDHRAQRSAIILRDVAYVIEAHIELVGGSNDETQRLKNPIGKHLDMFKRRARKGQCFQRPYLGCREFPANFELVEHFAVHPELATQSVDLGYMLNDFYWRPAAPKEKGVVVESNQGRSMVAEPTFFRARMVNGVIKVPTVAGSRGAA